MRAFPCVAAAIVLLAGSLPLTGAIAAEPQPTGEWRTANGLANVRIDDCGGILWGIISWEKVPGGTDSKNPDPALRNRPTLGLHILRAMKPTSPGLWEGEVYNAEDGQTYDSKISLSAPDVLKIEGCVLGFLCGGEEWTRVKADTAPPSQRPTLRHAGQQHGGKPKDAPPAPPQSACAGIPATAR